MRGNIGHSQANQSIGKGWEDAEGRQCESASRGITHSNQTTALYPSPKARCSPLKAIHDGCALLHEACAEARTELEKQSPVTDDSDQGVSQNEQDLRYMEE